LTMIAETMLPEAYLKGGNVVGLSTLAGFLIAIFSKTLEPADPAGHGAPPAGHGYRQEARAPVVAQTSVPPGKVPP